MAELSPAAKAVDRAIADRIQLLGEIATSRQIAAAALRAAVDQLAQVPIVIGEPLKGNIAKDAAVVHVADLFAIATELENHQ